MNDTDCSGTKPNTEQDCEGRSGCPMEGNPFPTITNIDPSIKTEGSDAFTMTIYGTDFIASSKVRFNGSDRTTTYVSSTQLKASIPSDDLITVNSYNITVYNPTPGGGTSDSEIFTVTQDENITAFRVWINKDEDEDANGRYDSGEGVEGASVWVNNEENERGKTDSEGIIHLVNIKDSDKIYAHKEFYSKDNPKAEDSKNFNNNKTQNPYLASNDKGGVDGKMYHFVMASDIMTKEENDSIEYYDFPGKDKNLLDAPKDSVGNVLIQLVHPKIEWNLVLTFQEEPGDFVEKLETGLKEYADYMYDFTDGYSIVRNVVLVIDEDMYKNSDQWNYCDIQIMEKVHPNASVHGNRSGKKKNRTIEMGRKWRGQFPDENDWYTTLGHESGHYLFGFYDEYLNNDGEKFRGGPPWWEYRREHDGDRIAGTRPPENEPNEFPKNYDLMDWQYSSHEMSNPTYYFQRTYSSTMDNKLVTSQFKGRMGQSCWEYFKTCFKEESKREMNKKGIRGLSDSFFENLIVPPYEGDACYPNCDSSKRSGPESMNRNKVNIIEWPSTSGRSRRHRTNLVFSAALNVVDEFGDPIPEAHIWLVSSDRKSFQGNTDEKGIAECGSLSVGKRLEAYFAGKKAEVYIDEIKDTYSITLPLRQSGKQSRRKDNTPGIIVSARPDNTDPKYLLLTISGDSPLVSEPELILSQTHGHVVNASMTTAGTNLWTGIADYIYDSGAFEVNAISRTGSSDSISSFEIYDTEMRYASGYHSPHGDLEMRCTSDSFEGSGSFAIVNSSAPAPDNGNLVQVGNVWSLGFSDQVGAVHDVGFTMILTDQIKGLDANHLNLYGWDTENKMWDIIPGGGNNLKYFGITLDSLDYVSYALFAPKSDDTVSPNPVTGLVATTGTSRWSIELQWTAPSDNQGVYIYDLRYNTTPISEANWDDCDSVGYAPWPAEPETVQHTRVEMPDPNTDYYFGIRAIDAASNQSSLTTLSSPTKSHVYDADGDGYKDDSDGDRMPDNWEQQIIDADPNDDIETIEDVLPDDDYDEDEDSNLTEYENDTDPTKNFKFYEIKLIDENGSLLGRNVAISDDYAMVRGDDYVHVFKNEGDDWIQESKFTDGKGKDDKFGCQISISGDYVIAGAYADGTRGYRAGSAYIFKRTETTWAREAKLIAGDGLEGDNFGYSVSISRECAISGSPWDDDQGSYSGTAYIFRKDGASWVQEAKLKPSDGGPHYYFGTTASISGDYAIVGTQKNFAYIFKKEQDTWHEQAKLTLDSGVGSVSISGDYAVVGSSGSVSVFRNDGETWSEEAKLTVSNGNGFGSAVSISGDYLVVGAYLDDENGENSGSAYLFRNDNGNWIEVRKLTASDGKAGDKFGDNVAISENYAIVGTYPSYGAYIYPLLKPENPVLSVSADSLNIPATKGTTTFEVANTGRGTMEWTATTDASWLSISPSSGTDDGTITVHYDENTNSELIVGTITITAEGATDSPKTLRVNQEGIGISSLYVSSTGSRWAEHLAFTREQPVIRRYSGACRGVGESNFDQTWGPIVTPESKRIFFSHYELGDYNGFQSGQFRLSVYIIDGSISSSREGRFLYSVFQPSFCRMSSPVELDISPFVESDTFFVRVVDTSRNTSWYAGVTSFAIAPKRPVLSVTPNSQAIPSTEGTANFDIANTASDTTMKWNATTDASWLSVSPASGTNDGTVTITYGENSGTERTGTITITAEDTSGSPKTIQVTQAGFDMDGDGLPDTWEQQIIDADPNDGIESVEDVLPNDDYDGDGDSNRMEYENETDPTVSGDEIKLTANDGSEQDGFGAAVSIHGDYALIGAGDSDSAYIFGKEGIDWVQKKKLTASDTEAGDNFGASVFISGDYAIIGAYQDDVNGNTDVGSAYIFKNEGGNWTQIQKIVANDGTAGDNFGIKVCISESYAIIGAYLDNDNGEDAGSAYVFENEGDRWVQKQKLVSGDIRSKDNFGFAVSFSGNYAIIGTRRNPGGAAYIFFKNQNGNWNQVQMLTPDNLEETSFFGRSVSLSGNYVIVGALSDDEIVSNAGAAYIYENEGGNWNFIQKIADSNPSTYEYFGSSVHLSGDYAVVGAPFANDLKGGVFIFRNEDGNWIQQQKLFAADGKEYDTFGKSVSMSGNYVIAGTMAGAAYIYKILRSEAGFDMDGDGLPDTWEQQIIDADPNDDIETIEDVLPDDDYDEDGDSNRTEHENETDPTVSDTGNEGNEIHVPGDYLTIQAAIDAANYGDIVLVAPGTYLETITLKAGVKVQGQGAESTVIDGDSGAYDPIGDGPGPVVTIVGEDITDEVILSGFTIRGGRGQKDVGGGGIYVAEGASPIIENNTVTANVTGVWGGDGGGIYVSGASPVIQNNTITGNKTVFFASGFGGNGSGIFITDSYSVIIQNNKISDNQGVSAGSNNNIGGGMYISNSDDITISENVISGNLAKYGGGGIYLKSCSEVALTNNTVSDNEAVWSDGRGGGICIADSNNLTLKFNTITSNSANNQGGGVYVVNTIEIVLMNNIISGNRASSYSGGDVQGGGFFISDSNATLTNNTISHNSIWGNGGGIYVSGLADVSLKNNIISNNSADSAGGTRDSAVWVNDSGVTLMLDYNNIWPESDASIGLDGISFDPLFVDAENRDYHLQPVSPCIDAGDPASDYSNEPSPNGNRINMGRYGNTSDAMTSSNQEAILSVSKTSVDVLAIGNTFVFEITNVGTGTMNWSALSNASWMTIEEGNIGTGNSTVTVNCDVNSGAERTGTITITAPGAVNSPQSIEVKQKAETKYLLEVLKDGTGYGTVRSTPVGINSCWGTCGPDRSESYDEGTLVSLTATPAPSSIFSGWSEPGCEGTTCDVTMDAAKTVTATFTLKTYTINASAREGGTVSPSGSLTVGHDGRQSITITPDECYRIADVIVDGTSVGTDPFYTFRFVSADHTIEAIFEREASYTITASADSGGQISPAGDVNLSCGTGRRFTITPDENYRVSDLLIDGQSIGAFTSYTFRDVNKDYEIEARFTPTFQCTSEPNVRSARSGRWDDPNIWNPRGVPDGNDVVLINDDHVITAPSGRIYVNGLCNHGQLRSYSGRMLFIWANSFIDNYGQIRGRDGRPAQTGSSVVLYVRNGRVNNHTGAVISSGNGGSSGWSRWTWRSRWRRQNNGGRGGSLSLISRYLYNRGLIRSGNGGNSWSACPGNGGNLTVGARSVSGSRGQVIAGRRGRGNTRLCSWQRSRLRFDPDIISLSGAETKVEGEDVTIFGGNDFILDLTGMDTGAISADANIILAVGEGGIIDLTGNTGPILSTTGQVTIFSDNILLDEGTELANVIQAENIVTESAKIIYDVSVTAPAQVVAEPGTTVSLTLTVANAGPEEDTYNLSVSDTSEWNLGISSEQITVGGFDVNELTLEVTLPANLGEANTVTVTAVSQADPDTLSEAAIAVVAGEPDETGDESQEDDVRFDDFDVPDDYDTSDNDEDGMMDGWETVYELDTSLNDASEDADDDGISNIEEYRNGTDPTNPDTDEDGMPDKWETDYGLNPVADDASEDPDDDTFSNIEEYQNGTHPNSRSEITIPEAGIFIVGDFGIISIDWLYDGGAYKGQLGLFSLEGMDLSVPDPVAFITEAVNRVLSGVNGYVILSDRTDKARFSGILGGESTDWNQGDYLMERVLEMPAGERFALVLVPNSTFEALAANPGTTDRYKRPLFSFTSPNAGYGMHTGQVADINGMGMGFVFEDMEFTSGDKDYNDLIIQLRGAVSNIPTIDVMLDLPETAARSKRGRRDWHDWRLSDELGRKIIGHLEATPTDDDMWTSVTFDGSAALNAYDSEGRVIGTDGADMPGSFVRPGENGGLTVCLPAQGTDAADYRIVLRSAESQTGTLTVRGNLGAAEISSATTSAEMEPHQVLTTEVSAGSLSEIEEITVNQPEPVVECDFNADGTCDDTDIEAVSALWNTCVGEAGYDPFFDLDDDGCVTILDIMRVVNGR